MSLRQSWSDLPEEAEHTVIEVREPEVGGWDPDVERVANELRQELLPLAAAVVSSDPV